MSGPPETFTLGLVLGPGGNARETYLREKFGFDSRNDDAIEWRPDMAVVSGIAGLEAAPDGERAAVSACKRLGACGLSSVPSWLRPYECLSNGEAARVDVAAALAAHQGGGAGAYCVVDDFACVVNRDAARSMSCAVGKYVRKLGVRNVVLATSHADVCAYLQPDWVYDITSQTYTARPTATAAPPKISIECDWSELDKVPARAARESEIPNFKGSYLGRFPLVSADFWTSDHLSERSRSVDAFHGTRARGTLTLKRS